MAKTGIDQPEREAPRNVKKYAAKRAELLAIANNQKLAQEERYEARLKLQKLPRDASPVRCATAARSPAAARHVPQVRSGRNKLREIAMRGEIPGVIKASW
jgi:small subunit ribosomal protein S14